MAKLDVRSQPTAAAKDYSSCWLQPARPAAAAGQASTGAWKQTTADVELSFFVILIC